jgi:hypothetical protein
MIMRDCIDIVKAMVQLFSLDEKLQVSYASEIPDQGYGTDFAWNLPHSPLREVAINFDDYIPWLDENLGNNDDEALQFAKQLSELFGLMQRASDSIDFWSKQAIRERAIWNVIRRTAGSLLDVMGWSREIPAFSFEQLVAETRDN